jgi:hypothetical protein
MRASRSTWARCVRQDEMLMRKAGRSAQVVIPNQTSPSTDQRAETCDVLARRLNEAFVGGGAIAASVNGAHRIRTGSATSAIGLRSGWRRVRR